MSRVACFVMDRVFHRFGLSSESFIHDFFGCILSTRTGPGRRTVVMTAILTTMIPCSAKQ